MALFIKRWVDVPNEPYDPKVIALKCYFLDDDGQKMRGCLMRHSLAQSFSPVITAVADNRPLFRAAVHWLAAEAVCTHADAGGHSTQPAH